MYFYKQETEAQHNFLASEVGLTRISATFDPENNADLVTTYDDGTKIIKAGMIFPSNDSNAEGIVFEDVDVTHNTNAGSIIIAGRVYEGRLAVTALDANAKTALHARGIYFEDYPETVRDIDAVPDADSIVLGSESVTVAESATVDVSASVLPEDASQAITVVSDNPSTATASYNATTNVLTVSGIAAGITTITLTATANSAITAELSVTVTA